MFIVMCPISVNSESEAEASESSTNKYSTATDILVSSCVSLHIVLIMAIFLYKQQPKHRQPLL